MSHAHDPAPGPRVRESPPPRSERTLTRHQLLAAHGWLEKMRAGDILVLRFDGVSLANVGADVHVGPAPKHASGGDARALHTRTP